MLICVNTLKAIGLYTLKGEVWYMNNISVNCLKINKTRLQMFRIFTAVFPQILNCASELPCWIKCDSVFKGYYCGIK